MKKIFSAIAVLTAFAMVAVSCNDDDTKDEDIPVTEVKVTPATVSVVAGTTTTLKAEVLPENATNKTVEWISRTPETATVDKSTGVVTGIIEGEAEIWALSADKTKHGKAVVTVTAAPIRVEKIELSKTELPLFVGKTEKLTYTINPENATDQTAVWDSSNKTVATIADDGTVTALAEGTADITLTIDEKTATCKVTVSTPAIEGITMPYLSEIQGNTVTMTAAGFKAGDKVKIEALAGDEYSAEADVANVTAQNATFELPAAASRDRSYKLTVLRDGAKQAETYLRPNDQMVRLPYALGYFLTGTGEVVADDASLGMNGKQRMGYVPGKIFEYDETTKDFMVWKADAALVGKLALKPCESLGGEIAFDFTYVTGIDNLNPLKDLFDMSNVSLMMMADSNIKSLDMSIFPEATKLYMWGTKGQTDKLESITFGDGCKLAIIQIERQNVKGVLDLRKCVYLEHFSCQDNNIESIELGKANQDTPLAIYDLNAENNKLAEVNVENCGQIRKLLLKGNPIERLTILNNSSMASPTGITMQQYVYILKRKDSFSLSWASAADAKGERVFNIEHYWWRYFSDGNAGETGDNGFDGGWVENNPIVQALADGVKVICWTYNNGGGQGPAHVMPDHEHNGGEPCPYDPSIY